MNRVGGMKKKPIFSFGFSLLELLIVLVIISLMTSVITRSIGQYRQCQALQHASLKLISFLIRVQAQANWLNQSRQIRIKKITDYWQITATVEHIAKDNNTNENLVTHVMLLDDKSLEQLNYNALAPIIFYGRRNMALAGHISLINNTGEIQIIISTRGRIRRCFQPTKLPNVMMGGVPKCQ